MPHKPRPAALIQLPRSSQSAGLVYLKSSQRTLTLHLSQHLSTYLTTSTLSESYCHYRCLSRLEPSRKSPTHPAQVCTLHTTLLCITMPSQSQSPCPCNQPPIHPRPGTRPATLPGLLVPSHPHPHPHPHLVLRTWYYYLTSPHLTSLSLPASRSKRRRFNAQCPFRCSLSCHYCFITATSAPAPARPPRRFLRSYFGVPDS